MTYATAQDLVDRFGAGEIDAAAGIDTSARSAAVDQTVDTPPSDDAGEDGDIYLEQKARRSEVRWEKVAGTWREVEGLIASARQADPKIVAALADAAAEIDAALHPVYVLPLTPGPGPWPLLVRLACDLARHSLYANSAPEIVVARAATARATLTSIRSGSVTFLADGGAAPTRRTAVASTGGEPVMTRENLEGL